MLALYLDENVSGAITRGLRARAVDVLTVQEDLGEGAPDAEVLARATLLGRLLFSQDRDLLREAAQYQSEGRSFPGVVYAHPLLVPVGRCIEDLELIAGAGEPLEYANCVVYLPLR